MLSDTDTDFDTLVPQLRDDIAFSNRNNGSGLSHMIEVESDSRFYEIGENEYRFLCYLDGELSLREAFEQYQNQIEVVFESMDERSTGLTWNQVKQLFHFLHSQNLLSAINGQAISTDKSVSNSPRIQNVNPIGFRLKLFNAEATSVRLTRQFGWLFGTPALMVWSLAVLWSIALLAGNSSQLFTDAKVVIQPENWAWLTLCWIMLKMVHESAHAICCKVLGGKVGEAGIHFLLLLPMPYVDVSSSWKFESKWKRIAVALAGIYAELFAAAVFVMLWAYTDNPVMNSIAVQMMLMASLSTLVFNINPLMRFDGYFVLSDLLKRPNLATHGAAYQKGWIYKTFFGIEPATDLANVDLTTRIYGWLAAIWKIAVAIGLLFAAAKLFHGAGIILAATAIFIWYIKPFIRFVSSLFQSASKQAPCRLRTALSLSALGILIWTSTWIPWPFAPNAFGVVDFADQHTVRAPSDGFLIQIKVQHGQRVAAGEQLAVIENQELNYRYQSLQIDRRIALFESRRLRREDKLAEYQAKLQEIEKIDEQIEILDDQNCRLELLAPHDGFVVANDLEHFLGAYFEQGDEVMKVVASNSLEVVSCAGEFDAPLFRENVDQKVTVEFESGVRIESQIKKVEPTAIRRILHPALSAENGGPLAVSTDSTEESELTTQLTRPVFKVTTASLSGTTNPPSQLRVGQRCRVYLCDRSHTVFRTISFGIANWVRDHWNSDTDQL